MVLIRPPSEANSLIIRLTTGCSDNNCIFCPAYKDETFQIKDLTKIETEIVSLSKKHTDARRIFFADGDAIIISQEKLIKIFELACHNFKKLTRISIYGSIKSLKTKSVSELIELKNRKLGLIYLGMETGDDEVYKSINKFGSPKENVETCLKIKQSGIKVNSTIIIGLGGKKYSKQHAINTAKILSDAQPEQIAALTLMVVPGTPLYEMLLNKTFVLPDKFGLLEELSMLIKNMSEFRCLFFSNHASNYYQISARFPDDKPKILSELDKVIKTKNTSMLIPDLLRDL